MSFTIITSSQEVEMIVLGCMIDSIEKLKIADDIIKEDDFADDKHKIIFNAVKETHKTKGVIDILTLAETLKSCNKLKEVGSYGYLTSLIQFAGTSAHIEAYCEDLRQLTIKRSLIKIDRSILEDLEKGIEPHQALERLEIKVENLKASKPKADSVYRHFLDPVNEGDIAEEIRNTSPGVRVGFTLGKIDLKIPGGAITIVAGPTGHGKTLLTINFALNYLSLHEDKQVFFLSFEESRAAILSLFLNTYINLDLSSNNRESIKSYFRDRQANYITLNKTKEFLRLKDEFFKSLIESGRLNISYCDYSAEELVAAIRFLKKNTNVGLVVIDYMQLLRQLNKKSMPRQEELKQICLMIKDCAVDTGLPILLAAQFNRTVVNEKTISPVAIGEAGDIERAANMIIGMWNRNYEGFTNEGNIGKCGKEIPKESAIYLEILKGRETGIGHAAVYDLQGNSGKLSLKNINVKAVTPYITDEDGYEHIATINRSN
jgi:replicative DNA helicase